MVVTRLLSCAVCLLLSSCQTAPNADDGCYALLPAVAIVYAILMALLQRDVLQVFLEIVR